MQLLIVKIGCENKCCSNKTKAVVVYLLTVSIKLLKNLHSTTKSYKTRFDVIIYRTVKIMFKLHGILGGLWNELYFTIKAELCNKWSVNQIKHCIIVQCSFSNVVFLTIGCKNTNCVAASLKNCKLFTRRRLSRITPTLHTTQQQKSY